MSIHVAWFPAAVLKGQPALGTPETIGWDDFVSVLRHRRIGEKDGTNFVPARFQPYQNGLQVRRKAANVIARTAVALDIEADKNTGELPPAPAEVATRLRARGWAGVAYTSHSHNSADIRYRVVLPLSDEIGPQLPAPEIVAGELGLFGVLDRSKIGPASLFYLPSCADETLLDQHELHITAGRPLAADRLTEAAGRLLAQREAEQARMAAEAHAAAAERLAARIAVGFDPDDSLIEKLRGHLDLTAVLLAHGYDQQGGQDGIKYRHPNSASGAFGADIKTFGGIQRVYSHNASDPLHHDNLPAWCGKVTALDAFDVVTILDFGGDRTRALRELAQRLGLTRSAERKAVAKLIFRMVRQQAPQEAIEAAAYAEGLVQGLTRDEVNRVSLWCAQAKSKAA